MNNTFKIFLVICLMITVTAKAQIVVNEVSAANYSLTQDNFGNYEDWIELYNSSPNAVDLSGYYLSDRINNNTKWQIPAGCTIDGFGFKLFWCTSRDTDDGGVYHTNFKLSQSDGESAVLSNPSGNIIDAFTFTITNQVNHSRGRIGDGNEEWAIFKAPTPGTSNLNPAFAEYPAPPLFSHEPGFYTVNLSLTLTSEPGTTIYYTLNGNTPNQGSTPYTGPINLTQTTVVRAIALNPDDMVPDGFIETNTYFLNETFSMRVISISGDQVLTLLNGTQIEPVGHFEIFDQDGEFKDEGLGEYNKHGNDSWAYQQRGIDWITRDEFGYNDEINYRVFRGKSRQKFQRLMMKAAANCNYPFQNGGAHVRDLYVQSLSQVAGLELDERTGEFCVMFANGQYWGVYDVREKVDDHDYTDYYYNQKAADIDFIKTWGGTWEEYGSIDDWNELRDFILGNDMSDAGNYAYVKTQFNTLSIIDYFIINSYVVASDWLNWNTGWWRGRNPDGGALQWRYILWDMDAVFGHYINYTGIPNTGSDADICFPEALSDPGGQGHVPIWNKLLENEDFQAEYVNRMSGMSNSYFSCDFMIQHLDSLIGQLEPEMPRQVDRWGGDLATWSTNVQSIYTFIENRCAELNNNVLDCYEWLDGPYQVTVNVEPASGGRVKVNTVIPQTYPYVGTYFGGIQQNYEALAMPGFEFSHWTVGDLIISPDSLSEQISFELLANASLTAHFEPTFLFNITFDVFPEGAGSIGINDVIYSDFTLVEELGAGVTHDLEAIAAPGYIFDRWEVSLPNQLGPSLENEVAGFQVAFTGSVKAYFLENNNVVMFDVQPSGTGFIALDGERIESYPSILDLPNDFSYTLEANPDAPFYRFSHWALTHHDVFPDSSKTPVEIVFNQSDLVVAHFREIPNYTLTFLTVPKDVGAIRFADTTITTFPHTIQVQGHVPQPLESVVPDRWEFEKWGFAMNPNLPGRIYPSIQYTPTRNDTIILYTNERFSQVFIPTAFSPNGDGVNELIWVMGPEISANEFEWVIYSRFGDLVFKSTDINESWNGSVMNSSYFCPVGVYTYHLKYKNSITNQNETLSGSITLVR